MVKHVDNPTVWAHFYPSLLCECMPCPCSTPDLNDSTQTLTDQIDRPSKDQSNDPDIISLYEGSTTTESDASPRSTNSMTEEQQETNDNQIETILDSRHVQFSRSPQYKIRLRNGETIWGRADGLENCETLLAIYHSSNEGAPGWTWALEKLWPGEENVDETAFSDWLEVKAQTWSQWV